MSKGSKNPPPQTTTTTSKTEIPAFLQPHIENQARIGSGAVSQLSNILGNSSFVPGFTGDELTAQGITRDFASKGANLFNSGTQSLQDIAGGQGLDAFLDPTGLAALRGATSGGIDHLDPTARATLQATAAGDFLHGGEGFNAALSAATDRARQAVNSNFGGGVGGRNSGLAKLNLGGEVARAFAGLHQQGRQNQLSAANALAGFSDQSANRAASAGGTLAGLSDTERQRALGAAGLLPSLGTGAVNALAGQGAQQRALDRAQRTDRANQLSDLAAVSQGVIPASALLGQTQTTSRPVSGSDGGSDALGTALSIAGIAAAFFSNSAFKEDMTPVEGGFLEGLRKLEIFDYRYKPEMALGNDRHIGPSAEQFKEVFGVGDGIEIKVQDVLGVMLGSMKEIAEGLQR